MKSTNSTKKYSEPMNSNKNKLNSDISVYLGLDENENENYFTINLFLLLFMGPTVLFGTIYGSHYTISTNFYLYLQYFQQ